MWNGLLLAVLFLTVTIRSCESSCEEQQQHHASQLQNSPNYAAIPGELVKRYKDIDYDSFVGLMGRRSAGESGDMHDVFVGLMGRRSSQSDDSRPWRKDYAERRPGIFFNKCKMRFCRGI
ncbi:tachykinin-3-like isoform X1 [Arapaima gigas]